MTSSTTAHRSRCRPDRTATRRILGFVTHVLDISYDPQEIFSTPDRIVVRAVAHGRGVAAVHGEAVAGKPYDMNTIHVYRTRGTDSPSIGASATNSGCSFSSVWCRRHSSRSRLVREHLGVTIPLYADRVAHEFDDLLEGNAEYRERFSLGGFDGIAHAGVCMVTCMDSRIEPLEMIGLRVGDAKIIRTPGGRVTPDALIGCILGVHLLGVDRILVVPHTRCAMAGGEDADIVAKVRAATGDDLSDLSIGASPDQAARLREDVDLLAGHPHLAGRVTVGGFLYDVDNGEPRPQWSSRGT